VGNTSDSGLELAGVNPDQSKPASEVKGPHTNFTAHEKSEIVLLRGMGSRHSGRRVRFSRIVA
jgi:hypothetical protein